MSVEQLAISAVVDEGGSALRKLYATGVNAHDFPVYEDEFRWIERRLRAKKSLNRRVFQQRFPDFEYLPPRETIQDLAAELREERAFEQVRTVMATLEDRIDKDNAVELAAQAREELGKITRSYGVASDIDLDDWETHIEDMRQGMILARQGISLGIPTGFAHLDHHLGGFMPGQLVEILGRTGEGKSFKLSAFGWTAKKNGYKVGIFTPEMSAHEVRCRYHTLASADKKIQKAVGLQRAFRNRALLFRKGFPLKKYQALCEYLKEMPGRFHLLSGNSMHQPMTVGYIEDRVVELELDLVLIDPIYLLKPVRYSTDGNQYTETQWTGEAVHHLGERYNIPIIFTNQAHMDKGRDDAPHKADSFGTKSLVHISDYVIGVKNISNEHLMMCRCSKSRFGEDGFRYEMGFWPNVGVFKELTPIDGSYYNGSDDPDAEELERMIAAAVRTEES